MLSALAFSSKAYWGYSSQFMEACRNELTVPATNLDDPRFHCAVAELCESIVGYYALERLTDSEWELEALFVEPTHIGSGIGRALIEHAKAAAAALGATQLIIQGDPNAEHFYTVAGGMRIGERESESIPGRKLPLFAIKLARHERR
ncbi:Acetyltransferase (GNAT) family protein [Modicisalibacter ilicicola DSM 19980]|uniref:Acetyltransferase (GNAT) family protein n=1 Tax=Modicisalibacter ilicicola DSM 19980 TaxID=1121942 RepID=A0A1M4UTS9_9GAMM|nr:GNAT family N-acetyltransferase [Halomonas ilicicola]SHE60089.1 Acetyltransferase (GNAT) family protein [Halomonas ilicicola DSM 19980]